MYKMYFFLPENWLYSIVVFFKSNMRIYSCNDNEEKCTNLTRFKIEKLRNFLMVNEMEVYTAQLLIGMSHF